MGGPSGTVTFLFTDVEGSTRLWEAAPVAMRSALGRHDEIVRGAIDRHGGYVFATGGDGFGAAFGRAGDAVGAALEAQAALSTEPWPEEAQIRVRVGLHTGEVEERDGDYFGPAVNRAARLMALGNGGQVLCSSVTAELVSGVTMVDVGEHRLRDLSVPQQVFQIGSGQFPPLRSVDTVPTNLPVVLTELIGRDEEVDEVAARLARHRLVTLAGVGGVGKTRLALAVAAASAGGFADGCWFVDLAAVSSGEGVAGAVAGGVGAPMAEPAGLARYLAERRMLIVLDNCEHVLDAASDLVDRALSAGRDPVVLATSREPLGVVGEQVSWVRPLPMPPLEADPTEIAAAASVQLFVERAAAANAELVLDGAGVEAVAEICRHLDGIPLALELAAARVATMAPSEIADRLDERFRLLGGGSRRSQERHRTLQAALGWSHDLLSEHERVVFRRMSVFPASFDLRAAEAVAGLGVDAPAEVVLRLVERCLVVFEPGGRYRMLETVRQFAADRLADSGEADDVGGRHAAYFCAFADKLRPQMEGTGYEQAREQLLGDGDNLRVTRVWLADRSQWAELSHLCRAVWLFSNWNAPRDWFQAHRQALEQCRTLSAAERVTGLGELAYTATFLGDYPTAVELDQACVATAALAGLGRPFWAEMARFMVVLLSRDNPDTTAVVDIAAATLGAAGNDVERALALPAVAISRFAVGEADLAKRALEEAITLATGSGNALCLQATVAFSASAFLWQDEPDFASCAAFFDRHADATEADSNFAECTRQTMWGHSLLATSQPGAVEHLVHASMLADRLDTPQFLDFSLRLIAIACAISSPLLPAQVAGWIDTRGLHPLFGPFEHWAAPRFEALLGAMSADERQIQQRKGAQLSRRQILNLVIDASQDQ